MPFRVFSLNEVADYLHITPQDVEMLVRSDEIPFEKQGDRLVFRQKEIDAWASRRILGFSGKHLSDFHKKSSARFHDLSKQHAIIPEITQENFLEPQLPSKTKASVIREMAALAERTGLVCYPAELLNSVEERERLCSTALAGGIALLHPKNHEPYMFVDSFIVIGKTVQPIPFGSPDGSTTDTFFLVCCQDDRIHLHVLARICMMCHQTSMLLELRETQNAHDMYQVLLNAEKDVIQHLP